MAVTSDIGAALHTVPFGRNSNRSMVTRLLVWQRTKVLDAKSSWSTPSRRLTTPTATSCAVLFVSRPAHRKKHVVILLTFTLFVASARTE